MRPADVASGVAEEPQNKGLNWFQRWKTGISSLVQRMDTTVGKSPVGRFFRLKGSGHVSSSHRGNKILPGIVVGKMSLTQRHCQLKEIQDACLSTEIRAGMTTFATMSYIIAVNVWRFPMLRVLSSDADYLQAFILAESGYGCPCEQPRDAQGNCANKAEWTKCYDGLSALARDVVQLGPLIASRA